jgi:ribonuclease P protein component
LADKHIDIVIVCRKDAAEADYEDLMRDVAKLLHKSKIVI